MCDSRELTSREAGSVEQVPVTDAVGMVLAHDITEIRPGAFKGRAFRKGHVVRQEDIDHLRRLGKENLSLVRIGEHELHENDAATALSEALMGEGVCSEGEPKEGKINIIAKRDGLLWIDRERLLRFNLLGDVMCATLHGNTRVRKGQIVAGTRAIPLVIKKSIVEEAVKIAECGLRNADLKSEIRNPKSEIGGKSGVIQVRALRKPRVGVVITGNEVYHGRIKDAFAPVILRKIDEFQGEIVGVYYAPDDEKHIADRLRELLAAGADLLITTGGMSVDPDDVTRFAIRGLGAIDMVYGSAVLPGAMVMVGYLESAKCEMRSVELKSDSEQAELRTLHSALVPVIGIPACGMYHKTTVFDLLLPRLLAGERIGRRELAELGHGGLCLNCPECRYPVCPFGK